MSDVPYRTPKEPEQQVERWGFGEAGETYPLQPYRAPDPPAPHAHPIATAPWNWRDWLMVVLMSANVICVTVWLTYKPMLLFPWWFRFVVIALIVNSARIAFVTRRRQRRGELAADAKARCRECNPPKIESRPMRFSGGPWDEAEFERQAIVRYHRRDRE